MKDHDLHHFIRQSQSWIADEYARIQKRSTEDPGTAVASVVEAHTHPVAAPSGIQHLVRAVALGLFGALVERVEVAPGRRAPSPAAAGGVL